MKVLIVSPNYYESAILLKHMQRTFNNLVVCSKILKIFEKVGAWKVQFKVWYYHQDALKYYYNCLLKVCKEIYGYNTKFQYLDTPSVKDINFPDFTDLTFKSNRDFLLKVSPELYLSNPLYRESANFSDGFLYWEYEEKNEKGELEYKLQDTKTEWDREEFIKNFKYPIQHYNFNEINKDLKFENL